MGKIWMLHVTVANFLLRKCMGFKNLQNNGVCPASTHVRTKVRTHGTLMMARAHDGFDGQ